MQIFIGVKNCRKGSCLSAIFVGYGGFTRKTGR